MFYNLEDFGEYLCIKDFNQQNVRDWKLLIESPSGVKSKIASLGDYKANDKSDLEHIHVDFITGLFEDNDRYLFQIIYRDFKDGTMKIYGKEFALEGTDKENIIGKIAIECFQKTVGEFKKLLRVDNDDSILARLAKVANIYEIPLIDEM